MLLEIKGDRALFSRHESKAEKISYEVPTPSAIEGILKSIYWKPEMKFVINKIYVINEPKFELVMENGQSNVASSSAFIKNPELISSAIVDRSRYGCPMARNILVNVHYVIDFKIQSNGTATSADDNAGKHANIFYRRAKEGQCFRQPCLGSSEFPCEFGIIHETQLPKSKLQGVVNLGIMLHHIDYSGKPTQVFYKPIMRDGVIDVNESSNSDRGWLFEELCRFYDRNQEKYELPLMGYSLEKITYLATLNRAGKLEKFEPLEVTEKGKIKPVMLLVPEAVKGRTSGIKPNFAYDNAGYVFGLDAKNGLQKRKSFAQKLKDIAGDVSEVQILIDFIEDFNFGDYPEVFSKYVDEDGTINMQGNIVFKIEGEEKFIYDLPEVKKRWMDYYNENLPGEVGICGVTGTQKKLADMHPVIKGVTGASAFTKLISVNSANTSFSSYGWKGLENSPMGVDAVHKYSSSLNWMLSQVNHRVSIDNSTFVFWAENENECALNTVKNLILGFKYSEEEEIKSDDIIYILELKANSSRLIVGGFKKFKGMDRDLINYCLKISGATGKNGIKKDWDYISEKVGGEVMKKSIGYELGELLAMLEKAQKDAVKSTRETKTIVDKCAEKACQNPARIFPKLLSDSIHHTNKVDYGTSKKIAFSLQSLEQYETPFPSKLTDEEKCKFFMGYYRMKNLLYEEVKKKVDEKKNKEAKNEQN